MLQADYVMGSRIDEPLTMTRSSTTYYYNTDGLGSVRQVLNSSGTILESYDYDPYGDVTIYNSSLTDITSSGSGIDNPYMFTGRRFDEETGIYHFRARQYDPGIGRFLQRDPRSYVDGMNLYTYVIGNPVNFKDPFGKQLVTQIQYVTVTLTQYCPPIQIQVRVEVQVEELLPNVTMDSDGSNNGDDEDPPEADDGKGGGGDDGGDPPDDDPNDDGGDDPEEPEYDSFEDAIGGKATDIDKVKTKNNDMWAAGFTEMWIGLREDGVWMSSFHNKKRKKWSGGHISSRNDWWK